MNSAIIIHIIGVTTLIVLLAIVTLHTSTATRIMIRDNVKQKLGEVADILSLQILYAVNSGTNLSHTLEYPATVSYQKTYNIYIGTGVAIMQRLGLTGLEANGLYVALVEPQLNIRAYRSVAVPNTTNIVLGENPYVFGSTTIANLTVTVIGSTVYLDINVRGVVIH